ncbi:hypothetical protein BJX70DRAFT_122182 [Aspergillus crustosus]
MQVICFCILVSWRLFFSDFTSPTHLAAFGFNIHDYTTHDLKKVFDFHLSFQFLCRHSPLSNLHSTSHTHVILATPTKSPIDLPLRLHTNNLLKNMIPQFLDISFYSCRP